MSTFSTWDHNNCNPHKPKTNRNNGNVQKKNNRTIPNFQIQDYFNKLIQNYTFFNVYKWTSTNNFLAKTRGWTIKNCAKITWHNPTTN
jgi:hypothetical protein